MIIHGIVTDLADREIAIEKGLVTIPFEGYISIRIGVDNPPFKLWRGIKWIRNIKKLIGKIFHQKVYDAIYSLEGWDAELGDFKIGDEIAIEITFKHMKWGVE